MVQDVGKLVVHGLEVELIHCLKAIGIKLVHTEKRHLDTTLSKSEHHCTGLWVVSRRTDKVNNAGAIALEELFACKLIIYIKPKIFSKHSQIHCLVVLGRNKVVVHISTNVLHLVAEFKVVGRKIRLLEPFVKLICVAVRVKFVFAVGEDRGSELIIATRGCSKQRKGCKGKHRYIFCCLHIALERLLFHLFVFLFYSEVTAS